MLLRSMARLGAPLIALAFLQGCETPTIHSTDDLPQESMSRYGNHSPYKVLGKTYQVMPSAMGYEEEGNASWYGRKFHGKLTSNREKYNMYTMTAAHKTLPLPTYVRVTRVDTGASIIVRVNDRGPFHSNRIIDLSYVAAKKLNMVDQGTARVKVEALTSPTTAQVWQPDAKTPAHPLSQANPPNFTMAGDGPPAATDTKTSTTAMTPTTPATVHNKPASWMIQAGAFSDATRAEEFRETLQTLTSYTVTIEFDNEVWHRVNIGPIPHTADLDRVKAKIAQQAPNPIIRRSDRLGTDRRQRF